MTQVRRIKRLETASNDSRDASYWFAEHLRALDGLGTARANIDAIVAARGSPGYRAFQAMIAEVVDRVRARDELEGVALTETHYAEMGAA
jgi:hypothetical protein